MSLTVTPTAGPVGAEIRGVDLSQPLDDATFAAIERAYDEYGVIFFRGQSITPAQQVAFTRRFGEIEFNIFGERWSVTGQSGNRRRVQHHGQRPADRRPPRRRELAQRHVLHGATAARDHPPRHRGPRPPRAPAGRHRVRQRRGGLGCPAGGDEARPRGPAGGVRLPGRKRAFPPTQAEIDRNPPVRHPIVRTHPSTGRKCLYVMRDDCTGIEGMEAEEAEALIAALADHIVKPAFMYRHQWRPGDVLMWDNCMVQHRAIQDYDLPQRRLMHRTTMGGAVPA